MSLKPEDLNPEIGAAPIAAKNPTERTIHGVTLADEYAWLRDPGYPEVTDDRVLSYLREENAYYRAAMDGHKPLVEELFDEFRGRVKEDDESVPVRDGGWVYKSTFSKGDDFRKHWRRPAEGSAEDWRIILDEPALAAGHDSFRLGAAEVSDDGALLAYATDTDGAERFTISIKRLTTGDAASAEAEHEPLPDRITNTSGTIVWLPDNQSFVYLELSEEWRPFRVRLHLLGSDPANDPIIYEEKDSGFFADADLTQDKKWLLIASGDHVTTEIRALDPANPHGEAVVIAPRRTGHEYDVDHAHGFFYIRTNDRGKNFRLVRAPEATPGEDHWQEVIAPSSEVYLRGHTCFDGFLAIEDRVAGIDRIRIQDYAGDEHIVRFPEDVYAAGVGENPEFDVQGVRLSYQSMVTPSTVYDYQVGERTLVERKQQEIPSGYDRSQYETRRIEVTARDGATVPVSIVCKKGRAPGGFVHLYGYGAYGYGTLPTFSITQLSLLDRGFAFAIAHIRGGDEMGYEWYEAGKLDRRMNTFTDFVDCARALVEQGYTEAGKICISGGSAGGELMGAVMNLAPELFCCVVAHVPFVDVLNTMLDETLPLTPMEWPEWGNPIEDKAAFETIRSYSPYDHVEAKEYPPTLVTAGLNDPRVTYWEPAKWVARLRDRKTDHNVLLLKTEMEAGHAGKSGRFTRLHETAEEMAFMLLAKDCTG